MSSLRCHDSLRESNLSQQQIKLTKLSAFFNFIIFITKIYEDGGGGTFVNNLKSEYNVQEFMPNKLDEILPTDKHKIELNVQ